MNMDKTIDEMTPAELFTYLSERKTVINTDTPYLKLTPGELIVLELNPDEFTRYKKDLFKKLHQQAEYEPSVREVIKALYGSKHN